jgi:hypothetical protein
MNNNDLKDRIILFGWITGLLGIIAVLWIFTQSLQAHNLLRTVNHVFINTNNSRRIIRYISDSSVNTGLFGYWFYVYDSTDRMLVFAHFKDGILVPLGAVVSEKGEVKEVIPLSAHARQVFDTLPQSIIQMYVKRIETALKSNMEGKGG